MSGSDFQIIPLHTIGRTILSLRPPDHDSSGQQAEAPAAELDAFQKQVSELFVAISTPSSDELLSLPWLRSLLEIFVVCQEDFRILLLNNKCSLAKPSMEKIIDDFYERSVKALDVCNAVRDGIEQMRQWQKLLEIVFNSLNNSEKSRLGEGQVRRSKKALDDLIAGMSEEKGSNSSSSSNHGSRSLESNRLRKSLRKSLTWSVSRSWSASRQLQAIACNLSAPKGNDVNTTHGLAVAVYTMNCVLFIVVWSLVAAIPCQDRGLQISHLSISRQFGWAAPILSIHEKITEESKKRERKKACGLLKEIFEMEKWLGQMSGLVDSFEFPAAGEKEEELRSKVQELQEVFDVLKGGMEPLERQVRQVFHMIVRSRIQGLDCFARSSKHNSKKQADFQALD